MARLPKVFLVLVLVATSSAMISLGAPPARAPSASSRRAARAILEIPCKCVSVYDGDTITVQIAVRPTFDRWTINGKRPPAGQLVVFNVSIRLLDLSDYLPGQDIEDPYSQGCWSPETYEPKGKSAKASMERMALGQTGTLMIDLDRLRTASNPTPNLARGMTLNRVFGDFMVKGYKNTVARRQINAGYAWPTKAELIRYVYKQSWTPPEKPVYDPAPIPEYKVERNENGE